MKIFWQGSEEGLPSSEARPADLNEALRTWRENVEPEEDNFFGLVDPQGRTMQFCITAELPADPAGWPPLPRVELDLPVPARKGSHAKVVEHREVGALIGRCFEVGADPEEYEGLEFVPW